jgi:hypothetical protein
VPPVRGESSEASVTVATVASVVPVCVLAYCLCHHYFFFLFLLFLRPFPHYFLLCFCLAFYRSVFSSLFVPFDFLIPSPSFRYLPTLILSPALGHYARAFLAG